MTARSIILFNIHKVKTKQNLFLLCGFVLFSLLSMGNYLPVYGLFYSFVPGWKYFRFPAQSMFLGVFCFSVLAGSLIGSLNSRRLTAFLTALVIVELFVFNLKANRLINGSFYAAITPNMEFLKKDRSLFRFILTPNTYSEPPEYHPDYYRRWLNFKDMLYPNTGAAYKLSYADGYDPMAPKQVCELLNNVNNPSSKILDIMNVKYVFSRWRIDKDNLKLAKDGYLKIYENTNCIPRFYFAAEAVYAAHDEIISRILDKDFKPADTVCIENSSGADLLKYPRNASESRRSVNIERYSPNETILSVSCGSPTWFVSGESYYPGWSADIDGISTKIYRANYNFRAVIVPEGTHKLVFRYSPVSFKAGAAVSLVSFVLLAFLTAYSPSFKLLKTEHAS